MSGAKGPPRAKTAGPTQLPCPILSLICETHHRLILSPEAVSPEPGAHLAHASKKAVICRCCKLYIYIQSCLFKD